MFKTLSNLIRLKARGIHLPNFSLFFNSRFLQEAFANTFLKYIFFSFLFSHFRCVCTTEAHHLLLVSPSLPLPLPPF